MLAAQNPLLLILGIILFVVKAGALVDCIVRPADQFRVVETLDKKIWLIILVAVILEHVFVSAFNPLGLLSIVGTVAALVYLAQLRGSSR